MSLNKSPTMMTRKEIELHIETTKRELLMLGEELDYRGKSDKTYYGWFEPGQGWVGYEIQTEAFAKAVEHFNDPEAGYKVVTFYGKA